MRTRTRRSPGTSTPSQKESVPNSTALPGTEIDVSITLTGNTVSVEMQGRVVVAHSFNAVAMDGRFGVLSGNGVSSFAEVTLRTNDPALAVDATSDDDGSDPASSGSRTGPTPNVQGATGGDGSQDVTSSSTTRTLTRRVSDPGQRSSANLYFASDPLTSALEEPEDETEEALDDWLVLDSKYFR